MRKALYIIIAAATLLTSTLAYGQEQGLELTISAAQKLAAQRSTQAKIDDLDIKMKESLLEDAKEDAKFLTFAGTLSAIVSNKTKEQVAPFEAEANLEAAKRKKADNSKELSLSVYKTALDILLAEKDLNNEEKKLKNLEEKLEMIKVQNSVGKATATDVSNAEHKYNSKSIDIMKAQEKLKSLNLDLKKLLNESLDGVPIKVNDTILYGDIGEINISSSVAEAISASTSVFEKEQNVKAKEKKLEIVSGYYKLGESEYDQAAFDAESAKISLSDAKINLEVNIRNKYNDVLNNSDGVKLAKAYETLALSNLEIAKAKHAAGVISKEELLNEEEKYMDAAYQEYLAVRNYNVAKAELFNMLSQKQQGE